MLDFLQSPEVQQPLNQAILLAALVSARLLPIVQLAPFLGGKTVPQQVKMALALALAVLVYPTVWLSGAANTLPEAPAAIAALVLKEVMVGFVIGFVAALVFDAVRTAGQIIDNSAGITQATSLAPQITDRVSLSANLLFQLTVVIFFVSGGHRVFLTALAHSFELIPPQIMLDPGEGLTALADATVRLGADTITLAVLLSFPVVAAILLANLFLALVNKSAPQINVFFLGMPIKAMLGVLVVMLGIDMILERFMIAVVSNFESLAKIIEIMSAK